METLNEKGIENTGLHPVELKYRQHLSHVDFETCPIIIKEEERRQALMQGWKTFSDT